MMNSIIHLTAKDFSIQKNSKDENVLCNNIKGIALLVYHSGNGSCKFCDELLPQYKKLPEILNSCKFATMDITASATHKEIIVKSKQTITPIKYVPDIVLTIDGRPFIQYDDEFTLEKLIEFVNYALKMINSKKSFSAPADTTKKAVSSEIPPYSIGIPYECLKGGTCMVYEEAYGKANTLEDKSANNN